MSMRTDPVGDPSPRSLPSPGHPYALHRAAKHEALIPELNRLTRLHYAGCAEYRRLVDVLHGGPRQVDRCEDFPYLPVRLFKHYELRSVPEADLVRTLSSSGTSGQAVSRIHLDKDTAARQTRALTEIAGSFIGSRRLPMLIVDCPATLANRAGFSARTAGILGFSIFGRNPTHALDDDMQIDSGAIEAFLARHGEGPVLVFGFTAVVWQHFVLALAARGASLSIPGGILIHGGGWKKLASAAVSPDEFKSRLRRLTGIARVHNYYGMVEQTGSIFMECEHGFLHASDYSEVIIRDPLDFKVVAPGVPGLIQLLSVLPHSYPGHSILTEDTGTMVGVDDCPCGRQGARFQVHGRLKDAETRGCSDVDHHPA